MASDADLARELRNGSDHAFAALYQRYKLPLFRYCLKMLEQVEAAEDVLQTVFLKVYEHRDDLVFAEKFKSWMYAIARNHCFTYLRARGRDVALEGDVEQPAESNTERQLEHKEETELVRDAIQRLGPDDREVLVLREYESLSYNEIAEITGISESAVKSRLFKARRRLYELLKPSFLERSSP
jgi:RNA polymerase sigma-70 factor (ECF subfamily)